MADLLTETAGIDQLVVVGTNNPSLVAELVGPQGRSLLRKTNCSVLVLRERQVP
jgi:nucleotide-binding universal stress UspA family protein